MKIKGKKIDAPKTVLLVLPRDEGDLAFKFQSVVDDSDFAKLCPAPKPPKKIIKGGQQIENVEDPGFKLNIEKHAEARINWLFLKSISATEGLEWETVKADDPSTWNNWKTELPNAGFSVAEVNIMFNYFLEANSLTNSKIEEARARFLASEAQILANLSSQMEEK